jgi:hypothetical protein
MKKQIGEMSGLIGVYCIEFAIIFGISSILNFLLMLVFDFTINSKALLIVTICYSIIITGLLYTKVLICILNFIIRLFNCKIS